MDNLFAGARVRAIPASAPFLETFVKALTSALKRENDPFALSDALILLPNRRASNGLIDAFAKELGGAALLPAIRPLGDLDEDVDVWGADPIALDIAPAISPTQRRLELARLVRARFTAEGIEDDPARALAMADELCRLLDSAAAVERVAWEALPTLVENADLAAHWKISAEFLEIVTTYWPQRLTGEGLADPAARRSAVLEALAQQWEGARPERPIIIAGSTGSLASTRRLMDVVRGLPKGLVVLPGLDSDLDEAAWAKIDAQHPQAALRDTLRALKLDRRDVTVLGGESAHGHARRILVREALAPADATADWLARLDAAGGAALARAAIEDLRLIEAANAEEEAMTIALIMRRELDDPQQTVALVTADPALSRRVVEKLARWNIAPNISHGRPLRETSPGALLALLCDLVRDPGAPIALAGLLKHPLAGFGLSESALANARIALEHLALRGPRRYGDLDELTHWCEAEATKAEEKRARPDLRAACDLARRVRACLAPILAAHEEIPFPDFVEALSEAAENVAASDTQSGERIWAGNSGDRAAKLIHEIADAGDALGAMIMTAAPRAFLKMMDGVEAAPEPGGDPRCAIWGPLEARLQRRDLLILGGLNEGVWPAPPHEDPFLSRAMRDKLGLQPTDARIGLAAHDFAQLASSPRVVLTRALKSGGAPSVASRWIWRLETLLRGAGADLKQDSDELQIARAIDAADVVAPAKPPAPLPPVEKRVKRLSVTQVETLIRDPYAIYARKILELDVLKSVGYQPGAAERGSAIHAAVEKTHLHDTIESLIVLIDKELAAQGFGHARRASERARLVTSARAFLDWASKRSGVFFLEKKGVLALDNGRELSGVADRIEIDSAGAAVIVDFKTGKPPSDNEVKSGLAPQLPLEAAMLARGVFDGVAAAKTKDLIYFRLGGSKPEIRCVKLDKPIAEGAEDALRSLEKLLSEYDHETQPYLSKPRVQFIKPYADYDQLARRKEWADSEGEE
ncbi:MAG: double-strand break repair protein AddB [Caulobacterales bacterium]